MQLTEGGASGLSPVSVPPPAAVAPSKGGGCATTLRGSLAVCGALGPRWRLPSVPQKNVLEVDTAIY